MFKSRVMIYGGASGRENIEMSNLPNSSLFQQYRTLHTSVRYILLGLCNGKVQLS